MSGDFSSTTALGKKSLPPLLSHTLFLQLAVCFNYTVVKINATNNEQLELKAVY
jgi:hypothetical protein